MKKILKLIFTIIDKTIRKKNKWEVMPFSEEKWVYLHKQIYNGKTRFLTDGNVVVKGDVVVEIHIHNQKMSEIEGNIKKLLRILNSEVNSLARGLSEIEDFQDVTAVYGRTVLHPIAAKFGFDAIEINNKLMLNFLVFWENLLKYTFESRNQKLRFREPKEIWISRDSLLGKLGDKNNEEKDN